MQVDFCVGNGMSTVKRPQETAEQGRDCAQRMTLKQSLLWENPNQNTSLEPKK